MPCTTSSASVAVAHTVMIAAFAVVLITVALAQVDRHIDLPPAGDGDWSLHAPFPQSSLETYEDSLIAICDCAGIFRVILHSIRFGLAKAFFLTFVLSWEEIGVTLFITSVDAVPLPRLMWMGLRVNIDPAIAAISVILIAIVVAVVLAKSLIQALFARRRSGA